MKKIITAFIFCFLCGECFSQAGEWVWLKGDSTTNNPGNFGTQGVPSPTNEPPSLYEACEWKDFNGNFWLFGGLQGGGIYNDLWKFDPIINEWTWMKGPGTPYNSGSYGIQGISSPSNNPPCRGYGILSWVDSAGAFWLFGGGGPGAMVYSDLWKYDLASNEWTWIKGPNTVNQAGVYGIQGIPDPNNNPGCRSETAASWTDNLGNLWMFGGTDINLNCFNDLWKFNIGTNEWTWMKGSQFTNQTGSYGIKGVEAPSNTPGARFVYSKWKSTNGNFWLLGGLNVGTGTYNDLWRFNLASNNWTWIQGDNTVNVPGTNGIQCVATNFNKPTSATECRATWTETNGDFWGYCFGNGIYNSLWFYSIVTNQWTMIRADSIHYAGVWGIKGVSSPCNIPPGTQGSIGWSDQNNHLYLFGGLGGGPFYNCLWKYTINPICTIPICPPTGIQENNFTNELLVYPNPTNSSLTISFSSSTNQNIELRIYNTLGKQIYFSKEEITKGKFEKEINVEKWSEGIYFLQVKTKDGNLNRKVVVQH